MRTESAALMASAINNYESTNAKDKRIAEKGRQFVRLPHTLVDTMCNMTLDERVQWVNANYKEWVAAVMADKKFNKIEKEEAIKLS